MNKLKQFYETLNRDIHFNELSVESMDILEQSEAYKRWLAHDNLRRAIIKDKLRKIKPVAQHHNIKREQYSKWFKNLKYVGNVLLCGFMAILFVMLFCWHIVKNDKADNGFETHEGIVTCNTSVFQEGDTLYYGENGSIVTYKHALDTLKPVGFTYKY
jgi:hypothetical protein